MRWAVAVLLLASGCLGSTPGPEGPAGEPIADGPLGPQILAELDATACAYNDLIWLTPREDVQALLPDGFTARAQNNEMLGAIVINAIVCDGPFPWSSWTMFAMVEPPAWPDVVEAFDAEDRTPRGDDARVELDIYLLAAHSDSPELRALYAAMDLPLAWGVPMRAAHQVTPTGTTSSGSLEGNDTVLATYTIEATDAIVSAADAHHRQWRTTPEGTFLIERIFTGPDGEARPAVGPAACVLHPDTLFFDIVGGRNCSLGQGAIGGFEWIGKAYAFPGVHPIA